MIELSNIKLAGVTFGNCQENIRKFGRKETGSYSLVREPDNPYDKYAITIYCQEYQLGFIPKEKAAELAPLLDSGKHYEAQFVQQNTSTFSDAVGLTVNLVEPSLQGITQKRLKKRPSKLFNGLRRQKKSIKERKRL